MKKISLAIAAIIAFEGSSYASSFTNNTNDLWLHRAQGQPQSCPKTITPKQIVDLGTSNYYCGYDICSSKDFDENDGCLEKVGSSTGQGGFATYLSLHPQAQSATDFCMIDNNIHFNCNIAKTESGFSMSELSFKSITQTDKNKNIVTLGPIKNYNQIPWRGVNISGLEYDGTYLDALFQQPDLPDAQYFAQQGMNTIRLPIRWEFLIQDSADNSMVSTNPDSKNLNTLYIKTIHDTVQKYLDNGLNVILDLHNYMRFCKTGPEFGQNNEPTNEDSPDCQVIDADGSGAKLSRIWGVIAKQFADLGTKYNNKASNQLIFEIMNEPYSDEGEFTTENLFKNEVQVVKAIRSNNLNNWILMDGTHWDGLHSWTTQKGPADKTNSEVFTRENLDKYLPNDKYIGVDLHQYFDSNFSGLRQECVSLEDFKSRSNLNSLMSWANTNKIPFILGEFGASAQSNCKEDMDYLLNYLSNHPYSADQGGFIGWTAWRANRNLGVNQNNTLNAANPYVYCLSDGSQCQGIKKGDSNALVTDVLDHYLN